jgi:small conductance mechanosensitive channel
MDGIEREVVGIATQWLPRLGLALAVLAGFWLAARVAGRAILALGTRARIDRDLSVFLSRCARVALALFGVVTALGTLGINVSALVAGLGLTGFALGFALKDTISNLLSGVLILLYHPFIAGDRIRIAGLEGRVTTIDLRYTELDGENTRILIPNSKLFTDPIEVLRG